MKAPYLITSLIIITSSLPVLAQENENPYYTDNLDVAVKDAESKKAGSTHVGNLWYNRSTAKSFGFPKLLNKEMSSEIVDGALDATAAGPGEKAPVRQSPLVLSEHDATVSEKDNHEMALLTEDKSSVVRIAIEPSASIEELSPQVYKVPLIEYRGNGFSGSAKDISSSATSHAYITPVKK